MQSFTLQPVIHPVWIVLIVLGLVGLLALRPTFAEVPARRRLTLVGLRAFTIFLVMTMLLRPGCVTTVERQQSALLVVLADMSRSMQLPHAPADVSRWEKFAQMLAAQSGRLAALAENSIEVRWLGFDSSVQTLDATRLPWTQPDFQPSGPETDLGTSLAAAIRAARQERLIGVVLASDGVQNAVDPRVELPAAAEQLATNQTPLYAVAFGPVADAGQSADVAVVSMPDHFTGFVKNQQTVRVTLRARGFTNRDIPVQLLVTDADGQQQVVATRQVRVVQDDQDLSLNLAVTPERAGNYRLTVRVEPFPGEVTEVNNELSAFMTIYEGGLRVLFLHGDVSFESKYLAAALGASGDIQVDELAVLSRNRGAWPLDLSEQIRRGNYDVFILQNLDSRAIYQTGTGEATIAALLEAVDQGKGLIMLGGVHSFGPGLWATTPLADVLPVRMDVAEKQDFDVPIRFDLHLDRELRLRPAGGHFVTRLSEDGDRDVWQDLPPINGANRWIGVGDQAQILLESTDGDPILVAHTVGGRVLAMAADSTWRWHIAGFAEAHRRFWRQIVLWLARRDGLEDENVAIDLGQRRYEPHSLIEFRVMAKTATGDPIPDAAFQAKLIVPDGSTTPVDLTMGEGRGLGTIDRDLIDTAGIYTIEVAASEQNRAIGSSQAQFMVYDRDKEKSNPAGDPDQLARLANRTADWGGRLLQPEEFGDLLEQIATQTPDMKIEIPSKWQLGNTLNDALVFLLLFVGSLTTEWFLRKRWGLV